MDFQQELRKRAHNNAQTIIIPESEDERVLKGASIALTEGLARIILLGEEERIRIIADQNKIDLTGAVFRDPRTDSSRDHYKKLLLDKRAAKGMTEEMAQQRIDDPLWFGALALLGGDCDGMVVGATYTSADVFHAALQVIGPAPGTEVVSVACFMEIPQCSLGREGLFLFSDCVVVENPTTSQLASIALSSAQTWRSFIDDDPRVALISYSTKGSSISPLTNKVRDAARLVREKQPNLVADGELQLDAAIDEKTARRKCPDSPVEGRANILVFPDLNSANSNLKTAERLGGGLFRATLVQGLAQPINDLSRGTTAETVADTIAATVIQAGESHA
ncbi:MAG: phosphate acyltransferase [Spirochaetales bacterium]|nr:phosphate acyltransferase [Spirochaetales bacterium]